MDKLKLMTGAMASCAREVISAWESRAAAAGGGEVTVGVGRQFTELTADVISHTAFGSSYREGKQVFISQRELQMMAFTSMNGSRVPGMPTKSNRRRWSLERKVRDTLMAIIDGRLKQAKNNSRGYGSDLLGLMLEANAAGEGDGKSAMSMDEIIDECKTFFFARQDTVRIEDLEQGLEE
jgi:PHYB activation tagged suppressor 1